MCFIRLAYFILALFRFYVTTGTIPCFDQISNISIKLAGEGFIWSTYLVCFIFLLLLKISSTILSPALRTFAPYIIQYNKGLGFLGLHVDLQRVANHQLYLHLMFDWWFFLVIAAILGGHHFYFNQVTGIGH